ncbi:uncharacterized protein LOC118269383 isoform X1 [Spodoptera frugiperda]|uniref:Uncharacterized protein LOC118269383 isoform X1 n=1 Tax=Spodoptera frugiperda TaxID=7108 RepID=A0A9R0EKA6_SPOFR|nr:uncharacterized protein LOC118269383 isoform X1 [Spodoptera frugiperda]
MEEINDVQALEKISSEVDESQIKVILSSQCIKAQAFLLDKLKKQAERHKETCGFISSANLKLEAEIKQAELEINSMQIAQETIKCGNVELKKELLLTKVRKTDIIERVEEGKKKYEAIWQECKARYESIPFVQKLLNAQGKVQTLNNDIEALDKEIITLFETMKTQRQSCLTLDKKRCIELANFVVNEMPNIRTNINDQTKNINEVTKQIEEHIIKQKSTVTTSVVEPEIVDNIEIQTKDLVKNDKLDISEDDPLIPRLELTNLDLDIIDVDVERAKMLNEEISKTIPSTADATDILGINAIKPYNDDNKAFEYVISPYFNLYKDKEAHNFSKRKLINILEDVQINNEEVYNIVKKVNLENLRTINEIPLGGNKNVPEEKTVSKDRATPIESDNIEEVDITGSNADILIPPTQFLDITLTTSQDGLQKKRVSFDIPSSVKINEIIEEEGKIINNDENDAINQTINSQLDVSVASEDSFMKIQDMIIKKHNLDLSPQFVYAKNSVLQKKDDVIVKSKFFQNENLGSNVVSEVTMDVGEEPYTMKNDLQSDENLKISKNTAELNVGQNNNVAMDVDDIVVSSPKESKKHENPPASDKAVAGLLFTHGTQAIPDSLNASMSTTGFEDSDFPHCIDSSLLLSPKADIPLSGDNDAQSQEVPNFLSGFRKAGLSFFGGGNANSTEPKPDSSAPNDGNNFSFNFGGEKKNRGGLFSLFN